MPDDILLVSPDLAGIPAHLLLGLGRIAHLTDQPVGNMTPTDRNSGSGIPKAAAHAGLDRSGHRLKGGQALRRMHSSLHSPFQFYE